MVSVWCTARGDVPLFIYAEVSGRLFTTFNGSLTIETLEAFVSTALFTLLISAIVMGWAVAMLAWMQEN
jgi:hypothetical protein